MMLSGIFALFENRARSHLLNKLPASLSLLSIRWIYPLDFPFLSLPLLLSLPRSLYPFLSLTLFESFVKKTT